MKAKYKAKANGVIKKVHFLFSLLNLLKDIWSNFLFIFVKLFFKHPWKYFQHIKGGENVA